MPPQSPWLNKIEAQWQHGKQAVVEPSRTLDGQELEARLCAYYGAAVQEHLVQLTKQEAAEAATQPGQVQATPPEQPAQTPKTQKAAWKLH